jgi:hypothetical protein
MAAASSAAAVAAAASPSAPVFAADIAAMAMLPLGAGRTPLQALCKPTFSAWDDGLFACGTEEQDPAFAASNRLVFGECTWWNAAVVVHGDGDGDGGSRAASGVVTHGCVGVVAGAQYFGARA